MNFTVLLYLIISGSVSLVAGLNFAYGSINNWIQCGGNRDSGIRRWYHNGADTGKTGGAYRFYPSVTFEDEGQYECRVGDSVLASLTVNVFADLRPLFRPCERIDGIFCHRTVTQGQNLRVCVSFTTIPATLGSHEVIPLGYRNWEIPGDDTMVTCNSSVCWHASMEVLFEDANTTCLLIRNMQPDAVATFGASTPPSFGAIHFVHDAVLLFTVQSAISTSSIVVPTASDIVPSSVAIQTSTQYSPGADSSVSDSSLSSTVVSTSSDIVPSSVAIQTSTHSPGLNFVYGTTYKWIQCGNRNDGRWYHNGADTGKTGRLYSFEPSVTFAHEGQYECRVGDSLIASLTVNVFADLKPLFRTCDSREDEYSQCHRTVTQGQNLQVCVSFTTIPATLGSHEVIPLGYRNWEISGDDTMVTCNSSVCWHGSMEVLFEDANTTCLLIRNMQPDAIATFGASTPPSFGAIHFVHDAVLLFTVQSADPSVLDPSTVVSTSRDKASSSVVIQSPQSTGSIAKAATFDVMGQVMTAIFSFIVILISVIIGVGVGVYAKRRRRGNPDPLTECSADGKSPIAGDRGQLREFDSSLDYSSLANSGSFAANMEYGNDLYDSLELHESIRH